MKNNLEKTISNMCETWNVEAVEQHIVASFLEKNSLDLKKSKFLGSYLKGLNKDDSLMDSVDKLDINSIYDLVSVFELLIPPNDKIQNGAFFTPAYIVNYIIETIHPKKGDRSADISCGSGAFIVGLLTYYCDVLKVPVAKAVKNNIFAFDILPYNVRRTKIVISLFALLRGESIDDSEMNVCCLDSLAHKWTVQFDNIVGNPPYVRVQDMDEKTKNMLEGGEWETTKYGSFNTYFAFFERGRQLLTNEGKLGYITPNNYFTSLSAECLREFIQNTRCIYKIVDFNATKVFNARTYTAITFMGTRMWDAIEYAKLEDDSSPESFLTALNFTPNKYTSLNVKKWRLLTGDSDEIVRKIEQVGDKLGDLFNICAGIATLKDEIYIIAPKSSKGSLYHIETAFGEYDIEKNVTLPLVKIADMKSQSDIDNNDKRIIFPYYVKNGKAIIYTEEEMKAKFPRCFEYLESAKDVLATRGKGKVAFTPFFAYGRTQGLNRFNVCLFTPTFSKNPRFLKNIDDNTLFTNGYGFYLKTEQDDLFGTNPIAKRENLDVLQKILNSRIMHFYVKKTSVSIEGGYPCYQKNFIERFSIPALPDSTINKIRKAKTEADVSKLLMPFYQINRELPNLDE